MLEEPSADIAKSINGFYQKVSGSLCAILVVVRVAGGNYRDFT
ncbi:hypothetical protein QUF72_15625 [Desulfobacterales bacterium HSG2]|nr:hypothetical protein [Desulfobacterales bacterium HSG2]